MSLVLLINLWLSFRQVSICVIRFLSPVLTIDFVFETGEQFLYELLSALPSVLLQGLTYQQEQVFL